jgi:2-polyprenyl-6-methoxyphenol hydroxylase-like FAD-dependent oxidoreductase
VWPTNDGLTVTFIAAPLNEAAAFRTDLESQCMKTFDMAGNLGQRVRDAKRIGTFRGTGDLPNFCRKPYGENWALVGDAGLVMDPISGQGISQAFSDAELLSDAVASAFDGRRSFQEALAEYERRRNHRALPIYNLTVDMASFRPMKPEETLFFNALSEKLSEADLFFGLLAGVVPYSEYRSVRRLIRVLGIAGVGRAIAARAGLLLLSSPTIGNRGPEIQNRE